MTDTPSRVVAVVDVAAVDIAGLCHCDWDPGFHRDLNERRGKADRGAFCTNPVYPDAFGGDTGICTACLFGCAE